MTGDHDDGQVGLNVAKFDCLPLDDAPLLPFTLHVFTVSQACNPQPFNVCLQKAMNHIECIPLWKGDILLLKYDHEEETLIDRFADITLCHALVQIAIVCGRLGENFPVQLTPTPLTNIDR
jgi:hypothetical protein